MYSMMQRIKQLYDEGYYEEVYEQLLNVSFHTLQNEERTLYCRVLIGVQIHLEKQIDEEIFLYYERLVQGETDDLQQAIFENIKGLKRILEGNFEAAVEQFSAIIAADRRILEKRPTLYATALGNCIYALISMKQYRRAILLYNSIDDANMMYLLKEAPRTYFHVHENLLDAYIALKQWQTGMMIAETILSLPELAQHPRYYAILLMATGYIYAKVDRERAKELCLEAAVYFDFTKRRHDYDLAYTRLMEVLDAYGDKKLIRQYESIRIKV